MTNKEIVKWLESLKKEIGKAENRTLWHYAEAIDMAIEALQVKTDGDTISRQYALAEFRDGRDVYDIMESIEELPSTEPTGDLISRQAVLSLFPNSFYSGLAKQINALPSAPDSRQRGEWVEIENGVYVCPFCKNQIEALIPPESCPYCRADMKGGGE